MIDSSQTTPTSTKKMYVAANHRKTSRDFLSKSLRIYGSSLSIYETMWLRVPVVVVLYSMRQRLWYKNTDIVFYYFILPFYIECRRRTRDRHDHSDTCKINSFIHVLLTLYICLSELNTCGSPFRTYQKIILNSL